MNAVPNIMQKREMHDLVIIFCSGKLMLSVNEIIIIAKTIATTMP
jgi:hypothetical protein